MKMSQSSHLVENHKVEEQQKYDNKGKYFINGCVGFEGLRAVIMKSPICGM
jgi:hypothetical protein